MAAIEIFPIESKVHIGAQEAVVLSVHLKPGNVLYEVGFWTDTGEWREAWFNAFMVTSCSLRADGELGRAGALAGGGGNWLVTKRGASKP